MIKRIRKALFDYLPTLAKTQVAYRYPSLFSYFEIHPTSCMAMITDRCNSRCVMCKQWRAENKPELGTDDWRKIILDLRKSGIRNFHFTGGEPLLREDLPELVRYATSLGCTTGMTTNGFLLTGKLLDGLLNAGLRSIVISMDATGDFYSEIRGIPNSFPMVKKSVSLIAEAKRRKGIDASINFTLMRDTMKHFKEVKLLADEMSLPVAVCLLDANSSIFALKENRDRFWIGGGSEFDEFLDNLAKEKMKNPRSLLLNFRSIEYIRQYFSDPRQERIPCVTSQDRIVVDPYGNFLGGCVSTRTFGNLCRASINVLKENNAYRTAKRNMFFKKCAGCSCGYLFNIRCAFPFPAGKQHVIVGQ